jgi:hypothetical protein
LIWANSLRAKHEFLIVLARGRLSEKNEKRVALVRAALRGTLMPIVVSCPSCQRKLRSKETFAGRKVKCPKCGSLFVVKASAQSKSAEDEEAFTSSRSPRGPVKQPISDGFDFVEAAPDDSLDIRLPDAGALPAASSRVPMGLGIPAILLGVAGLALSLTPFVKSAQANLAVISLPLASLGVLLGLGGLAVALMRKGQGIGFPIAGSSCSLVAVAMAIVWLVWMRPDSNTVAAVATSAPLTASSSHQPESEEYKKDAGKRPPADGPLWIDASKNAAVLDDLRVRVNMVLVSHVKKKTILDGQVETPQKYLGIQLVLDNRSKTKKISYKGWSGATATLDLNDALKGLSGEGGGIKNVIPGRNAATVTDNFGNSYKRFALDAGDEIPGQVNGETSIYPDNSVEDLLIFEPPLENIDYLHLELPAVACGMTGTLYLQIPKKMIQR